MALSQRLKPLTSLAVVLPVLSTAGYVAAFFAAAAAGVGPIAPLTTVPVLVTAYFHGARGGTLAGLVAIPLNTALLLATGAPSSNLLGMVVGSAAGVLVGFAVGRFRDLVAERAQLLLREQATISAIPDQVVRLSAAGTVLHVTTDGPLLPALGKVLGQPLQALLPEALAERLLQTLAAATASAGVHALELWHAGRELEVRVARGSPGEAVCVVRDVSEARRAQAQLREVEKRELQASLAVRMAPYRHLEALGALSAGLAHEANNPLAVILSNLNYVGQELEQASPALADAAEVKSALADARGAATRLQKIVADLQLLAGAASARMEATDVAVLARAALDRVAYVARGRAVLSSQLQPAHVVSSSASLTTVLINLLLNAIQASRPGVENRVSLHTMLQGPMVGIEVRDTGAGIPAEVLPRIFDPFFSTVPFERVGLGLAVCHTLVSSLGGRIEVDSVEGAGSTFRVLLSPAGPLGV